MSAPVACTCGTCGTCAPWRPGDEPALLAGCSDPETQRWAQRLPSPYRAEHARAYVADIAPAGWTSGQDLTWAVCGNWASRRAAQKAGFRVEGVRRGAAPATADPGATVGGQRGRVR